MLKLLFALVLLLLISIVSGQNVYLANCTENLILNPGFDNYTNCTAADGCCNGLACDTTEGKNSTIPYWTIKAGTIDIFSNKSYDFVHSAPYAISLTGDVGKPGTISQSFTGTGATCTWSWYSSSSGSGCPGRNYTASVLNNNNVPIATVNFPANNVSLSPVYTYNTITFPSTSGAKYSIQYAGGQTTGNCGAYIDDVCVSCVPPTPSPTLSPTGTVSQSTSATTSKTISLTPSNTISVTPSNTHSVTPSISVTATTTSSASVTRTPSVSVSVSVTPSVSVSVTPSISVSVSATPSISVSATPSISASVTPSISVSVTPSISFSVSITASVSVTSSPSASAAASSSQSPSVSVSLTSSPTVSTTPSKSGSLTPSATISTTPSTSGSLTSSVTVSATVSNTNSASRSVSVSPSASPSFFPAQVCRTGNIGKSKERAINFVNNTLFCDISPNDNTNYTTVPFNNLTVDTSALMQCEDDVSCMGTVLYQLSCSNNVTHSSCNKEPSFTAASVTLQCNNQGSTTGQCNTGRSTKGPTATRTARPNNFP